MRFQPASFNEVTSDSQSYLWSTSSWIAQVLYRNIHWESQVEMQAGIYQLYLSCSIRLKIQNSDPLGIFTEKFPEFSLNTFTNSFSGYDRSNECLSGWESQRIIIKIVRHLFVWFWFQFFKKKKKLLPQESWDSRDQSPSFDKVVFQFDVIRSYLFTVDFGVNFGLTWGELLINTPLSINTAWYYQADKQFR